MNKKVSAVPILVKPQPAGVAAVLRRLGAIRLKISVIDE